MTATTLNCAPLALVVALFTVLLSHFLAFATTAIALIRYPFGFDYGEGIVWQQLRNILHGTGYQPIGIFPAIVYHYPPVYHLTVGGFAGLFNIDQLMAGRIVSFVATLGSAALVGRVSSVLALPEGKEPIRALGAASVALAFFSCGPVFEWAPLMRVDMLACLFSMIGFALALSSLDRPGVLGLAALSFVLAVFTKQTSVMAPAAAIFGLAAVRPKQSMMLAGMCALLGLIALTLMIWITQGSFLQHILFYNLNRMKPELLEILLHPLRQHFLYIGLAIFGAVILAARLKDVWRDRATRPREVMGYVALLAYFILKTLTLAMVMKSGAGINYMVEWFCPLLMLVGISTLPALDMIVSTIARRTQACRPNFWLTLPLIAAIVQAIILPCRTLTTEMMDRQVRRETPLVDLMRSTAAPIITDDMVLLIRAGQQVKWEPAIIAELSSKGQYDENGFLRLIRLHRFAMFVTLGDKGDAAYDARYNPPVAAAINRYYPLKSMVGGYIVHAPPKRP